MSKEKDYRENIDRSVKRLAKALNIIEALHQDLEFVFERRTGEVVVKILERGRGDVDYRDCHNLQSDENMVNYAA